MKLALLICAASVLLPASASAKSAPDLSHGNGLFSALSGCPSTNSFGKEHFNDDELHECLRAAGYIEGVVDALDLTQDGDVTLGQELEIVYAYLKTQVNQRQRLSVEIIRNALGEAFSRPKANAPTQ